MKTKTKPKSSAKQNAGSLKRSVRLPVFMVKTGGSDDYMASATVFIAAKSAEAIRKDPASYYWSSYLGAPQSVEIMRGVTAEKEGEIIAA